MEFRKIGTFIILACFLLALIPATVVAASGSNPVPLIAVDILAGTHKTQWTAEDFQNAGIKEYKAGNYEEAGKNFNKAEGMIFDADPRFRKTTTPWGLGTAAKLERLETLKKDTYNKMPGHEAEALKAADKARELYTIDSETIRDPEPPYVCLIATATFDSPLAPQVQQLREFREGTIYSTESGTQFMTAFNAWYYSFSPAVAIYIEQHPSTKPPMRVILTPLLGILSIARMSFFALASSPDISVIVAGLIASTLIGMVYAFPLLFVLLVIIRRVYPFTFTTGVFKILGAVSITGLALLVAGGLLATKPALLAGSVMFIVSLVLLTGLFLSWVCINRLDSRSAHANNE